ncbi:hypothetical protein [Rosistilla carotiformis]|uniref:hypothetical protein n=1 Tax=Rosistilla carotiformis TaxID=2528017 RepID=UPI00119F9EB3|nr:hypothetical protein [Rosistilla carotiformis]
MIFAVITLVSAGLLHEPLLSAVTRGFLSNDLIDDVATTHVYMMGGDRMLETAMEMSHDGIVILLPEVWAPRSVQCGAVPASDDLLPRLLADLGAEPDQWIRVSGRARDRRERIQFLGDWLDRNPEAVVCMLSDALSSGGLRRQIDGELSVEVAGRVKIKPLQPIEYPVDRWWRSTTGWKAFYGKAIGRFWGWLSPEGIPIADDLSPQEYEEAFRQRLQSLGVDLKPTESEPLPPTELSPVGAS